MKVLLVYPRYPDTFWSFKHILKFISKKAAFPPLGLLTVASMLPGKWEKRLVDANVTNLEDEDIAWADMVFISAMIVQEKDAKNVIDRCRAQGKTVVAGGPAFTINPDKFEGVDHLVLNEAEVTLPLFLKDLEENNPKPVYSSTKRPDINGTPVPLWSLIDFRDYVTMNVQFSRGCPFNCEFCDIPIMNGSNPRTKAPDRMIAEIQALYDSGWRGSIFIVDDNFIGNKVKVKALLRVLIDWQKRHKYPYKLLTEASTNLADDDELMKLMSAANFHKVFLGIETPNLESLEECSKNQNTKRDLGESVRIIHRNGLQVMGGFIVGFDSDRESIFETQIQFIQKIGVVTAMVGILNALPQTRLWKRLKVEGRLISDFTGENTDGTLNFIPRMGKEKLVEGYKKLIATIYSPDKYYKRIDTFMRHYRPTVKGSISLTDVFTFIRSMWRIGVLSKARFHYWKLLVRTYRNNKSAFPIAVELAIAGLHFDRVTRGIVCI